MPKVSVIVPVYNGRAFLAEALDSLVAQTVTDWEAIVVDDGSTDGSAEVAQGVDPRIRVVRQANQGLGGARNTGIEHAHGELVAFLDADDRWLPEKLALQLPLAGDGVVYGDALMQRGSLPGPERVGDSIRFERGHIFAALLAENCVPVLTTLLPRDVLERAGRFDASLPQGCEDYALWLQLAYDGVPFDYVEAPVAVYRIHPGAMSGDRANMSRSRLGAYERLLPRVDDDWRDAVQRRVEQERLYLAGELRQRAWRRVSLGDYDAARADLREAHSVAPSFPSTLAAVPLARSDALLRVAAARRRRG